MRAARLFDNFGIAWNDNVIFCKMENKDVRKHIENGLYGIILAGYETPLSNSFLKTLADSSLSALLSSEEKTIV